MIIILLEFAIAGLNTKLPMPSITEDIQRIDIPLNYLALYMRPVIFSSLALVYRIWLDLLKAERKANGSLPGREEDPGADHGSKG